MNITLLVSAAVTVGGLALIAVCLFKPVATQPLSGIPLRVISRRRGIALLLGWIALLAGGLGVISQLPILDWILSFPF